MTNIKTNETWALWPTKICSSFYELAANQIISGKYNFTLEYEFKINEVSKNTGERGTIISINPNYFVFHYYSENTSAFHIATNNGETHNTHFDIVQTIKIGQKYRLKIINLQFSDFIIYIDDKKVFTTSNFVNTDNPQIFLGSESFPWTYNDYNSCDLDLYEFKLFHDDNLVCHHDFNKIIHNKFVDLTNNCNFIHKI